MDVAPYCWTCHVEPAAFVDQEKIGSINVIQEVVVATSDEAVLEEVTEVETKEVH